MKRVYGVRSLSASVMQFRLRLTITAKIAIVTALVAERAVFGVELTEGSGAAHAYPAMFNLEGKKLANGEFTQQVEGGLLHIKITYDFGHGGWIEEKAAFRQRPELIQEEWS